MKDCLCRVTPPAEAGVLTPEEARSFQKGARPLKGHEDTINLDNNGNEDWPGKGEKRRKDERKEMHGMLQQSLLVQ